MSIAPGRRVPAAWFEDTRFSIIPQNECVGGRATLRHQPRAYTVHHNTAHHPVASASWHTMGTPRRRIASVASTLSSTNVGGQAEMELTDLLAEQKKSAEHEKRQDRKEHMMDEMQQAEMMKQMRHLGNSDGGGMCSLVKAGEKQAVKVVCGICCACACLCGICIFGASCFEKCCGKCCDQFTDCFGDLPCGAGGGGVFSLFGDALGGVAGGIGKLIPGLKRRATDTLSRFATVQTHTAAVPSHWRMFGYVVAPYIAGLLILMSFGIGSDHPASLAAEVEFCQQLRLSIDFNSTDLFKSSIETLLPNCYTSEMAVIESTYDFNCLDTSGRAKYSDEEMRNTIFAAIQWADSWNSTSSDAETISSLITSATCNATTGEGYYTLDGTHLQIHEACHYIRVFAAVSGLSTSSLLHDLHELHIPGCKGNHPVILTRTFEENCLPGVPAVEA